jgi:DNA invertase Pin-like site-specific DNA recombinase
MKTQKNSILYCRRSTKKTSTRDAQTNSLEVQEVLLRDFAKQNGSSVEKVFVESASGTDDERPIFAEALAYAHEHDCFLLVYRLDRLSRSFSFFHKIKDSLHLIRVAQLASWQEPDEFLVSILLSVASVESKNLSLRTRHVMRHLKATDPNFKPGNPRIRETAVPASLKVRKKSAAAFNSRLQTLLVELNQIGYDTLLSKATRLNELQITTRRGATWTPSSVARVARYTG